jgi:hypothetical protein
LTILDKTGKIVEVGKPWMAKQRLERNRHIEERGFEILAVLKT